MLSRHADSAFWIGRYVERAEATARAIDVHYHFGLESPFTGKALTWESILAISGQSDLFSERYEVQDERNILYFFAFDDGNPNSIRSCLHFARENGRSIRDQISSEMWQCLNTNYLRFREWNINRALASPYAFFEQVKEGGHLFRGITERTLLHGETRQFWDVGQYLERADQTARILDVKYHDLLPRFQSTAAIPEPPDPSVDPATVGGPIDTHGWIAVLKSVGAFEAFRKTFRQGVSPSRVAEFLILHPDFPASIRFSVGKVEEGLRRISGNRDRSPANAAERAVGRLYNDLNYLRAEDIVAGGLHEFLDDVQKACSHIGGAVITTYLRY